MKLTLEQLRAAVAAAKRWPKGIGNDCLDNRLGLANFGDVVNLLYEQHDPHQYALEHG